MMDDERFVIFGIMDVDEQVRQMAERAREERAAYARMNVPAGIFPSVFLVNPENGSYREYSTSADEELLKIPGKGEDFFTVFREKGRDFIDLEDYF